MTNEQTIKILDDLRSYDYDKIHELYQDKPMTLTDALDMAIKALQKQNCDQCEVGNPCLYCEYEFKAQADGEYISREAVIDIIEDVCPIYGNDYRYILRDQINELPSFDIPPEHDGCKDCRWQSQSETEMPCKQCKHNYTDEWEREKPTDTITMTREEFSEKLMEHYRQGRADEKAYQNGEIMQSFNPD